MTVCLNELRNAVDRLREALQAPETSLNRDAAIQRFEFCFELAWRAIQKIAREEGMDCSSPKGCLKLAFKTNWIAGEGSWLAMLNDRNLTVTGAMRIRLTSRKCLSYPDAPQTVLPTSKLWPTPSLS